MRVAITGSHGLIGTALAVSLRADRHEVVAVPRGPDGVDVSVLPGCDAVVNLAGAGIGDKRWTAARKELVLRSRTETTAAVAAACARADGPKVLLSGSAMGFYGDRGDDVVDERSGAGDIYLSEICRAWEAAAAPAAESGARLAFLRTGIVLSSEGGALPQLLKLFRLGLGGRLGNGRQWMSWISIDDEVAAIRWLLEHEVEGPVNLVAPAPVTNADFTRTLGRALHRPTLLPVPRFGPALLLGRELAYELLFISQRVKPSVLESRGFPFAHPTLDVALRAVL